MAVINVPSRISDNFGDGLDQFFVIVGKIHGYPEKESIELDMTSCTFLNPFFLLPLMVFINSIHQDRKIGVRNNGPNLGFRKYLDRIHFGEGLQPENTTNERYDLLLEQFNVKTYVPIINFPSTRLTHDIDMRDRFLSALNNLLIKQLNLKGGFLTAVMYLLDEAINNIVDHSKEKRGFIFAQSYPSRNFIDICIADSGVTILGAYQEKNGNDVNTDKRAIILAANGNSTKDRPGNEGRGFGIRTSKEMLVDGLKGKYLLLSGGAFLIKTIEKEEVVEVPPELYFKGTILMLRVPSLINASFDPSKYYGG